MVDDEDDGLLESICVKKLTNGVKAYVDDGLDIGSVDFWLSGTIFNFLIASRILTRWRRTFIFKSFIKSSSVINSSIAPSIINSSKFGRYYGNLKHSSSH